MKSWFLFLCTLTVAADVSAYIIKSKTILERAGKTRGEGIYALQQEVVFKNDVETISMTENWVVVNGERMYMDAKGNGFHFLHVYNDRNKFLVDEQGVEITLRLSEDFFEPWFHYRSLGTIGAALAKIGVLPAGSWNRENFTKDAKGKFTYSPETNVRLGRTQGVIAYAFGKPTPADSTQALPGVWFEQDRFFLRKIRFPSLSEVTADEFAEYPKGLWFPTTRTVAWGENRVNIRVLKIASAPSSSDLADRTNPSFLKTQKADVLRTQVGTSGLAPIIREFYSRFR